MKNLKIGSWLLALLLLLSVFSCMEEVPEYIPDEEAILEIEDEESIRRFFGINGNLKIISPTGDLSGTADADALQNAIDNVRSGGVIFLRKGDYYLNRTIYAFGFDGKIISANKSITSLTGVGSESEPFDGTSLFDFDQPEGKVEMMNISLRLQEGIWAIGGDQFFFGNMQNYIVVRLSAVGSDTRFKGLDLLGTGAVAGVEGFLIDQPVTGIRIVGDINNLPAVSSGGKHSISNSQIQKAGFWAHLIEGLNGAEVKIEKNHYREFKQTNYRYLANTDLTIKGNDMSGYEWGSVVVTQEFQAIIGGPNKVKIQNNTVETLGFMPVEIGFVPDGAAYFDLDISKNTLTNLGPGPQGFGNFTVIGLFGGSDNAKVMENVLQGESSYGIFVEGASSGSEIICNDLTNHSAYDFDYLIRGDNNLVSAADVSSVADEGTNTTIVQNNCDSN